jgi:hypothetical protein
MLFDRLFEESKAKGSRFFSRTKGSSLNFAALAIGVSGVLAGSIALGVFEFGRGVVTTESCIDSLRISFSHSTPTNENTTITGFTLNGINDGCAGKWLMVRLYGSSDQAIDEVVWQVAQGTTTLSTTDIATNLSSNSVVGVEYVLSDEQLTPMP